MSHLDTWGKVPCEKGIICAKTLGTELGEKGECEAIRVAAVRKGREMRQKEEGVGTVVCLNTCHESAIKK